MKVKTIALVVVLVILTALSLLVGSVHIPISDVCAILMGDEEQKASWRFIVWETRLPAALTALLCGSALAACGLMLQTAFRNPLAGPGIFGITNGAGLGVALVMLFLGGSVMTSAFTIRGFMAVLVAAFAGAMAVTAQLLFFSTLVRSNTMLLIVGIMVGYLSSSAIALLSFAATEEGVRSYVVWGLGSFGGVATNQLPVFAVVTMVGIIFSLMLMKPLNALLLGENYARGLGVDTRRARHGLLLTAGLLSAVTTAFCGPIAFLGLAVPHMARLFLGTANHRRLLPITILLGAVVALSCHLACQLPAFLLSSGGGVPVNAVTPLVGAPVIIYVVLKKR